MKWNLISESIPNKPCYCAVALKNKGIRVDYATPNDMRDTLFSFLKHDVEAWIEFPTLFYPYMEDRGEWVEDIDLKDGEYYFITCDLICIRLCRYSAKLRTLVDILTSEWMSDTDRIEAYMPLPSYGGE